MGPFFPCMLNPPYQIFDEVKGEYVIFNNCTHNKEYLCEYCSYIQQVVCTSDLPSWQMADARKSFPSGHSSYGFYSATFVVVSTELESAMTSNN